MAYVWFGLSVLNVAEWAIERWHCRPATASIAFAIACLAMWNCEVLRKKLEAR